MNKTIPESLGFPILGHLFSYKKDRLKMLLDESRKYDGIFKIKVGPKKLIVISEASYNEHVLQKNSENYIKKSNAKIVFGKGILMSNGEEWKTQRSLIQPLLSPKYFSDIFDDMRDITKNNIEQFVQVSNNGVNLKNLFSKITFDIILKTMIGLNCYDRFYEIDEAISVVTDFISNDKYSFIKLPEALDSNKKKFNKSMKLIRDIIEEGIENAQSSNPRAFINILKKAVEDNNQISHKKEFIRDNIFNLLFAGYDTSSLTLAWYAYEISQSPVWQQRCREEVRNIDFDTVTIKELREKMIFNNACINEAMRLYPPGWAFTRVAIGDDDIEGHKIKKEDIILCTPFLSQRKEDRWEKPHSFYPEHFLGEKGKDINRFQFFPFGAGPRMCSGMQMGFLQIRIIITYLLQNYSIELVGDHPQMDARVTLYSKNKYQLKLIKIS